MSNSASFGEDQMKEEKNYECESPSLYSKLNKDENQLAADDSMQAASTKYLIDESNKEDKNLEASKLNEKKKVRGFNFRNNISEKLKKQVVIKQQEENTPSTLTARIQSNKESNENVTVVHISNKPASERINNKLIFNENSNFMRKKKETDQLDNSHDQTNSPNDNILQENQGNINASLVSESGQASNPNIKKIAKPKKFNFHSRPKKESES